MRRVLLLAIASCGLLAIAPATSLAHSRHHHRRHHQRHHARHHIRKFGDVPGTTNGSGTSSPAPDAGTVASFSNGVLMITLADGSTVSGTVNGDTEIECMSSSSSMGDDLSRDGGGGDNGGSGDNSTSGGDDQGDQNDQGDDNDDQGDDDDAQACDMSALVQAAATHAAVRDAELSIGGSGAIWTRVDLG